MSTSLNVIVYGNENIFTVKIIDIGIDLIVPDTALFSDADVIFAEPFVCIDDIRYADILSIRRLGLQILLTCGTPFCRDRLQQKYLFHPAYHG